MFKKKKGSTLVTVLAVAVVFMTVALAIITSIMGTMKANINQKVTEDLRYAAEAGLEIARSHLEGKSTITQDDIDNINEKIKYVLVDTDKNNIPDGDIGTVRLVSPVIGGNGDIIDGTRKKPEKPDGGNKQEFKLKVKATRTQNENIYEEISVNYMQSSGNAKNIYDYGVVAGQGDLVLNNNSLNDFQVNVSAANKIIINGIDKIGDKYDTGNMFEQINFVENTEFTDKITVTKINENLYSRSEYKDMYKDEDKNNLVTLSEDNKQEKIFGFYDIKNKKKLSVTEVEIDLKQQGIEKAIIDGKEIKKNIELELQKIQKKSIIRIKVNTTPRNMTLLIFNSNELEIFPIAPEILEHPNEPEFVNGEKNLDRYKGQTLALSNYVILNSGQVSIKGHSTLSSHYSTIYGASVNIDKNASIHISTPSGTEGHGINKNDEKNFNKIFSLFIENWNEKDGLSTGKNQLKENTFDN